MGSYTPLKDSANLSVTITISDTSAENICGVLIDLANVLNIAAPTSYQILDRSNTSPSKLGLYQSRSKDGKEGGKLKELFNVLVVYANFFISFLIPCILQLQLTSSAF